MPAATTQLKNTTIQIRLPADAKNKINKRAKQVGLSMSEYARTMLILNSGALNEEIKRFWGEIEESEAQHRAGEHTLTSAKELIAIARKARNEN